MSNLISKSARDLIGIDSPWRGIVWSALMLRAGNVHSDRVGENASYLYKNAVRIAGGRQVTNSALQFFVSIEASIPYNSVNALADGGDFLPFVGEYFEGDCPPYTGSACSTLSGLGYPYSGIGEGMPDDDPAVQTLEQYLVWCVLLGERDLLSPTPNAQLPISIDFLEEAPGGATLKLSAKLFVDYAGYRASDNLVCSVLSPLVTPAIIPPPPNELEIEWEDILNKPNFADVATSGNYASLANRPTIPTKTSDLENDSNFLDEVDYPVTSVNGLTGAVQITAAIGQAEWVNILNKPNFSTVAISGSYPDLINKPTIPTKTSDLTNDSNFLDEVDYPVTSVNGQTGAVFLDLSVNWGGVQGKPNFATVATSGDYNDLSNKPTIPSGGSSGGAGIQELTINGNLAINNWYWVRGTKSLTLPDWTVSTDNNIIFLKILPTSSITFLTSFDAASFSTPGDYRICYKQSLKVWEIFPLFSTVVSATIKASEAVTEKVLLFTGSATTGQTTEDLFYWLGTNENTATWQHPIDRGKVNISASSVLGGVPSQVIDRNLSTRVISDTITNSSVIIEFLTSTFRLSQFRLSSQNGSINSVDPRQKRFRLDASNDNNNWTTLFTKNDDDWINDWYLSPILSNTTSYKYYRFVSLGTLTIQLGIQLVEIEFFGAWQL